MNKQLLFFIVFLNINIAIILSEKCTGGYDCNVDSCCTDQQNGPQCYNPTYYTCWNGNKLCPKGDGVCGVYPNQFCFSLSDYHCDNGRLVPGGTTGTITTSSTSTSPASSSTTSKLTTSTSTSTTASSTTASSTTKFSTTSSTASITSTTSKTTTGTTSTGTASTGTSTSSKSTTSTGSATSSSSTSTTGGNKVPVKLYGLDYNPKLSSGECPKLSDVEADVRILATMTYRVRIYSIVDCNQGQLIVQAVQNTGVNLDIVLGIWVDQYYSIEFPNEYSALLSLIRSTGLPRVTGIIVGSESQYRGDFPAQTLIGFLQNITTTLRQAQYPGVEVATADVIYNLNKSPILDYENRAYINQFPYWEGIDVNNASSYVIRSLSQFAQSNGNKSIVVSETGWPTAGSSVGNAVPSVQNLNIYLSQLVCLFYQNNIGYYWFSAFDLPFGAPGVEQNFGIYNSRRQPKPGAITLPVMC